MSILDQFFFDRNTLTVAQDLIGCYVVHHYNGHKLIGKIVETEAYLGLDDPASHAYRGKTNRNAPMFGPVGHAYVYLSYGMHYCFNTVARESSKAAGGVLIRAVEPIEGIELMKENRKISCPIRITNGPGKFTQAMGITMNHKGVKLDPSSNIYLLSKDISQSFQIEASRRIGISQAQDALWRFCEQGNKWVSRR